MRVWHLSFFKQLADDNAGKFAERAMTCLGAVVALVILLTMGYAIAVARGWITAL